MSLLDIFKRFLDKSTSATDKKRTRSGKRARYVAKVRIENLSTEYDGLPHAAELSVVECSENINIAFLDIPEFIDATQEPYEVEFVNFIATDKNNRDVTDKTACEFEKGSVFIRKKNLRVTCVSKVKPYDGNPLIGECVVEGLLPEDEINAEVSDVQKSVGECDVYPNITWIKGNSNNYQLEIVPGKLKVTEFEGEIRVLADAIELEYDGNPHSVNVAVEGLPNGYTAVEALSSVAIADATTVPIFAKCDHLKICNELGDNVTKNLNIREIPGLISINKSSLIVSTASATKTFDGTPLEDDKANITGRFSDKIVGHCVGSVCEVGEVQNSYLIDWDASGLKASNFNVEIIPGMLKIEPAEFEMTPDPTTVTYDGKRHLPAFNCPHDVEVSFDSNGYIDAGVYEVSFKAKRRNFKDYEGLALLEVRPSAIRIETFSALKEYDSEPLTASAQISGLVDKSHAHVIATGSLTEVGSCLNTYEIKWLSKDIAKNYVVEESLGILEIQEYSGTVSVSVTGGTFVYDGQRHTASVKVEGIPPCYTVKKAASSAFVSHVEQERIPALCDILEIENADGVNVTERLNIEYEQSFIEITPTVLTVKTDSFSKEYDSKPIAVQRGEIIGLMGEDMATLAAIPSPCSVGTYLNVQKLVWSANTKPSDYIVDEQFGSLEIADSREKITVVVHGGSFTYDGKPHSATVDEPILPTGYHLANIGSSATAIDVEQTPISATCDTLTILDSSGRNATPELNISINKDQLVITPRELVVMTPSRSKEYDGTPLTTEGSVSGLVDGETVSFRATGSQTAVGSSSNAYELRFDGSAKESNYAVTEFIGTLEVKERTERQEPPAQSEEKNDLNRKGYYTPSLWEDYGFERQRRTRTVTPLEERETLAERGFGKYDPYPNLSSTSTPREQFWRDLRGYERRAEFALNSVQEEDPEALVCQTFGEFATEFDDIRNRFGELFAYYSDKKHAIKRICDWLPNLFLVYVSDLARTEYSGRDLWSNLFTTVGIRDQNVQAKFKELFVALLYQRGMPLFDAREESHYLLYTALLHGGFSEDLWESLWRDSFLPMASDSRSTWRGLRPDSKPADIRRSLSLPVYLPKKKAVLNLLKAAPAGSIEALCGSAFKVALQTLGTSQGHGIKMLTSFGLSDTAMQALRNVLEAQAKREGREERLFYLDQAELVLDQAEGVVKVSWGKSQFPQRFSAYTMEYRINGQLLLTQPILEYAGRSILDSVEVSVGPAEVYEAEIRLMAPRKGSDDLEEIDSLSQTFKRSHPGCYEFLKDSSGRYRYRKQNSTLKRERSIAYLVKPGCSIEPVRGMALVNETSGAGDWGDFTIAEFLVSPSAAAVLVDSATGEELSAWSDRYSVRIDKSYVLGETSSGTDLYGFAQGSDGTNAMLPSVTIDLPEDWADDGDLRAVCLCDGVPIKLPASSDVESARDNGKTLRISFPDTSQMPSMAGNCELIVIHGSTADKILRYRFAIAPIQGFHLEDGKVLLKESIGVYQFDACAPITVSGLEETPAVLENGEPTWFERPLSDESVDFEIMSEDGNSVLGARLFLAGINITASEELVEAEARGPISLATLEDLGLSGGDVKISTFSRRPERKVAVYIGNDLLAYKDLEGVSDTIFNIFKKTSMFDVSGADDPSIPLSIVVSFGHTVQGNDIEPASAEMRFLNCVEGYGLGAYLSVVTKDRERRMRFESPAPCDLVVDFVDERMHIIESEKMRSGEGHVRIPPSVFDAISKRKKITVWFTPENLFGDPDYDRSAVYELNIMGRR